MSREFYLCRDDNYRQQYGSSFVKVPDEKAAVSGQHARITITDSGVWVLEDLGSHNGTYVRDDEGTFNRVSKVRISPDTVIRLGSGGHNSFTFWARRVMNPEADYSREFQQLQGLMMRQKEKEEKVEKTIERHNWLSAASGIFGFVLMLLFSLSKRDQSFTMSDMMLRMAFTSLLPMIVKICFIGDNKKLRAVKELRTKVLVCPKCGRPLSEFDINEMRCSVCKAS